VHGGSTPLDPAELAAVAVQDQAALIVISAAPAEAQALSALAECPVVVVPTGGRTSRSFYEGPIVGVVDPARGSGHVASTATRFALDLGGPLRLVHIGSQTQAEDVPALSNAMGATLVIVSANEHGASPRVILEAADVPVMLIPCSGVHAVPKRPAVGP
jgi:hypothetical protein